MSRLRHSLPGYLRSMQISRERTIAFVEGPSDRYFFGEILKGVCDERGTTSQTRCAQEVPGQHGGKQALLKLFEYLKSRSQLSSNQLGNGFCVLFFLDKDLDDLKGVRKRSAHVIYLDMFDVENHIFSAGDVFRGVAAASGIPGDEIRRKFGDPVEWLQQIAASWRKWVVVCAAASLGRIACCHNYGQLSQINPTPLGRTDQALLRKAEEDLHTSSGLDTAEFNALLSRTEKRVGRYYRSRKHDVVFKGKWYIFLLERAVLTAFPGSVVRRNGLGERIRSCVQGNIDFSGSWAYGIRNRVETVLNKCGMA